MQSLRGNLEQQEHTHVVEEEVSEVGPYSARQETRGLEEAGREVLYDTGRELETRHLSVGTLIFV
jgi:hypothetical protein